MRKRSMWYLKLVLLLVPVMLLGAVGDRPGILEGNPDAPILVAALTGHTGRVYLLGVDGRIIWEQHGCGNIHRARLVNGKLFYTNGRLWCVDRPGEGAARCVYDPSPNAHTQQFPDGEGVYGFDVLEDGHLLVLENTTDFATELTQDGKVVRKIAVSSAWEDGKVREDKHHHFRMCRATQHSTYLVCASGAGIVREYSISGAKVGEWKIGELAFDAYRTDLGEIVVSHLSAVTVFAPGGAVRRRWTCRDLGGESFRNVCGIAPRPNGNWVLGSFVNGTKDGSHVTACEVTPQGKCVWRFSSTNEVTMMSVSMGDACEAKDVRFAREQMKVFNAVAAQRFLADMKGRKDYDYARYAPAVEKLIAQAKDVRKALNAGWNCAWAVKLVAAYREAMLANPFLPNEILAVRRRVDKPRHLFDRFIGGYEFGFTGLNAHNHMDLKRTGYENDIVILKGCHSGTPQVESLYAPADGTSIVRDIDLDYDASRILFTSSRGTNNLLGVYEVQVKRGSRVNSATLVSPEDGKYDQQWWDACYLPNQNQIALLGTAAFQFLPCEDGNYPMCVIFRQDRKTGETRQLTFEQDSDFTPTVTHDGRIMFTRWEYSDLAHFFAREIMTMNPDGVGQLSLWGTGSYVPTFMSCARDVPGEAHLFTMFGGGHHNRSELGRMFLVDPTLARGYPFACEAADRDWCAFRHQFRLAAKTFPKEKTGLIHEFPGFGEDVEGDVSDLYVENQFARGKPYFAYPYPLSRHYNLATVKITPDALLGIWLVDDFDNMTCVAEYAAGIFTEPMPFAVRKRPPIIPDRSVPGAKTCSVHIADIYNGPGLQGVPRGTIKKLRVFSYHFNYHKTGGHSMTGLDRVESSWDVKRILGVVDVEKDGSVCFEMPAKTPVSFQPLDEEGRAVQLMRSWTVGMPGERVSCTGCHEDNRTSIKTHRTIADERYVKGDIQKIQAVDMDGVRPWGFAAEMWPVVKRNCAGCHAEKKPGINRAMISAEESYRALHPYIRRPGPESELTVLPPYDYHASTSPLVQILARGHHGVTLNPEEWRRIYEWIDLNCPYWGYWRPKGYETDCFAVGCANPIARRKELAARYGGNEDDPESEYVAYEKKALQSENLKPHAPNKVPPKESGEKIPAYLLRNLTAAESCAAQQGHISERVHKTVRRVVLGKGTSMMFRRIPAGVYVMGSLGGYPDESPRRVVTITNAFWMSEMEVNNAQYHAFFPEHDSRYQDQFGKDHVIPGYVGNHARQPVVRVSWNEATEFCAQLSAHLGEKVRLPTEEEWEWAARAGSVTDFPWGSITNDFSKYANLADRDVRWMNADGWLGGGAYILPRVAYKVEQNYPLHAECFKDDWFTLNFVGRTLPNAWGLYDMHGNAAEWTLSDYEKCLNVRMFECLNEGRGRAGAPRTPNTKVDGERCKVIRGGSFASRPKDATSSWRWGYLPHQKVFDVGFRVIIPE